MEEDEEELYSEMQLEDGGRRRVSVTSHNTLKVRVTEEEGLNFKEESAKFFLPCAIVLLLCYGLYSSVAYRLELG